MADYTGIALTFDIDRKVFSNLTFIHLLQFDNYVLLAYINIYIIVCLYRQGSDLDGLET